MKSKPSDRSEALDVRKSGEGDEFPEDQYGETGAAQPKGKSGKKTAKAAAGAGPLTAFVARFAKKYGDRSWWRMETALVAGAVVTGLLSAALGNAHQEALTDSLRQEFAMAEVLVLAKDVAAGQVLDRASLTVDSRLAKGVTDNAALATDRIMGMVVGKRAAVDLKAGDALLLSAVQGATDAARLAEKIPPGRRLFNLTIAGKTAGYGWVSPNDHVDILTTMDLPDRGAVTFTVLEDVTLVSVGAATVLDRGTKVSGMDISFFVAPDEFEILTFAQQKGEFMLSLRNPQDIGKTRQGSRGIDVNAFLDHASINPASGGGELKVLEGPKAAALKKKPKAPANAEGGAE